MNLSKEKHSQQPIVYVAIGNSLTAGIGAIFAPGFVYQYRQLAEKVLQRTIIPRVFARPGAKTGQIRQMICHPVIRQALKSASMITIGGGGNDLIQAARIYFRTQDREVLEEALKRCHVNMSHILKEVQALKTGDKQPYIIRLLDLYNPYPQEKIAEEWVGKLNRHLGRFSKRNVAVTQIYNGFKGKEDQLLFYDRLHPNAHGYKVIAEQLHGLGYGPLTYER